MSKRLRINLLKYGITGGVCLALVVLFCVTRDFSQMDTVTRYRTLCDAFTIPGVLALGVGALLWVSNEGALYGIGYCLSFVQRAFIPGAKMKTEKYYDYVMRRKGKKITGFGFLVISGAVCMGIAIVFMVLFYRIY